MRSRRRKLRPNLAFCLLPLLFAACIDVSDVVLPHPEVEAASVFLSIRSEDEGRPYFGFETIDAPPVIKPRVLVDETFSIEALFFTESLSALGVVAGPAESVDAPNRPLPPAVDLAIDVVAGNVGEWRGVSERAQDIANFRIPAVERTDCELNVERRTLLGVTGEVSGLTPIDDDTLLVTVFGRRAGLLTPTESATVTIVEAATATTSLRSGVRTNDGRLWFARGKREIVTARLEGATLYTESSTFLPEELRIEWFYVTDPDRPELVALARTGEVLRYDGSTWSIVQRMCDRCTSGVGGISEDEEGRLYFAHGDGVIGRMDGESFELLYPNFPASDGPAGGAYIRGLGFVAGTVAGRFSVLEGDEWRFLAQADVGTEIALIRPLEAGFIGGTADALLHVWRPDTTELCPPIRADPLNARLTQAVRWNDAWVFASTRDDATLILAREP